MLKPVLIIITIFLMGFTHLPLGVETTCAKPGLIALTFDDGITKNTPQLLKILEQEATKATFFIIGNSLLEKHGLTILQTMYEQGHFIANHTWSHQYLTTLTDQQIEAEVLNTQNGIKKGFKPYIRPPYGAINQHIYDKLTEMGYSVIIWNLDPKDWNIHKTKQHIWTSYEQQILAANPNKDSFILLLHERNSTLDLLPKIIYTARQQGFVFVNIHECLHPQ